MRLAGALLAARLSGAVSRRAGRGGTTLPGRVLLRLAPGAIADLAARLPLAGRRVLEVGCAQGEFLRELCRVAGCTGVGYDASYAGPEGPDPCGADLRRGPAPLDGDLPGFDVLISRFVLEHVADPYAFLVRLPERAGGRAAACSCSPGISAEILAA